MAETTQISPKKLRKLRLARKHPRFFRQNQGRGTRKRVKDNWRKPRGIDNKKREKVSTFGAEPNIGWRSAKAIRGLHPSGLAEVRVENVEMVAAAPAKSAVRIGGSVGKRKRELICAKARERGLKVLN
ncbi:MAG: 50S ribosomal protein L32e [Candidatus ainarchaeum sp.]|nr:50S ribosomal protein L32e [Candidatus ainarchaeum sp.]